VASAKDPGAFKTIGELSGELGVAQHILRYWESKFPQLKPLQRAGNRRYYRPADADLARRIHDLLANQGYTIRGVQKLLAARIEAPVAETASAIPLPAATQPDLPAVSGVSAPTVDYQRLVGIRDRLVAALAD
jgi:DNA-binding transcriptional MerR regulator